MDAPINPNAPLPDPVPYVGKLFGPLLVGVCMNCLLYGVLALQVLIYYMSYRKDPKWIRYFVLYLFFAETVNLGCNIATIYEPLVMRFGTMAALTYFPTMITSTPTTNVAISTPVQIFTAWRLVVLTRKKWLGGIIAAFSLLSFSCAIWTAVVITSIEVYVKKEATVKPAVFWFAGSVIADVVITLGIYFSLSKRRTGFKPTDAIINRIIRLTLQTGLLTLTLAAIEIVLFIIYADQTSNFAIDFPLSKLYSNALLSTLNARMSWRTLGTGDTKTEEEDNVLFGKAGDMSHSTGTQSGLNHGYNRRNNVLATNSYELQSRGGREEESVLPITISKNVMTDSAFPNSSFKY